MQEDYVMLFTTGLKDIGICYRQQNDGGWRECLDDKGLKETDFRCADPAEVTQRSVAPKSLEIGGKTYDIDPHVWPTKNDQLYFASTVFRRDYPNEPSRDQLVQVIANGDDSVSNVLILDVYGQFELRQSPPFNQLLNDPSIIVFHETFIAGNNYIGPDASEDGNHIEELFIDSLEYWKNHLKDGRNQDYSDTTTSMSYDEIQQELRELRDNWTPNY